MCHFQPLKFQRVGSGNALEVFHFHLIVENPIHSKTFLVELNKIKWNKNRIFTCNESPLSSSIRRFWWCSWTWFNGKNWFNDGTRRISLASWSFCSWRASAMLFPPIDKPELLFAEFATAAALKSKRSKIKHIFFQFSPLFSSFVV